MKLYGTSNSSYQIILDGTLQSSQSEVSGLLFSENDLSNSKHNISLVVKPDTDLEQLAFDRAVVTSSVPASYAFMILFAMQ